jgi:hypothetical protein
MDNNTVDYYVDYYVDCGYKGTAALVPGTAYTPFVIFTHTAAAGALSYTWNFGQNAFACPVPSGYNPGLY